MDCSSCDELRQVAPEFARKGLTNNGKNNLANNNGYSGDNNNCYEVGLANDCLLGTMPCVVNAYDDCNWKEWAVDFSKNVYEMIASLVAWNCGAYREAFTRYIAAQSDKDTGTSIAYLYYTAEGQYQIDSENASSVYTKGGGIDWDIYMDSSANKQPTDTYFTNGQYTPFAVGSKPADHDYVCVFNICLIAENFKQFTAKLTPYASSLANGVRPSNITSVVTARALHPAVYIDPSEPFIKEVSYSMAGSVLVRKGEHLKLLLNASAWNADSTLNAKGLPLGRIALHQMKITWIPVSGSKTITTD